MLGLRFCVVLASAKIVKIQLITTNHLLTITRSSCSCISKDNKNSANHNMAQRYISFMTCCSCISKDNKNSANHNSVLHLIFGEMLFLHQQR